ncbi:MAG: hypothetical protein ACR2JC_17205 [Chloroflexota bacterium]
MPSEFASGASSADEEPAWGLRARTVPRWPALLAVLAAAILYRLLPDRLVLNFAGNGHVRDAVPFLELALLIPLALTNVRSSWQRGAWQRPAAIVLIVIVNAGNVVSLGWLVYYLLHSGQASGKELLVSAVNIWLTNILVFSLWYWELDRGGPLARCEPKHREPDFLFPQMITPGATQGRWSPSFIDYLYVSFTNATAFSPTDTMPLTQWAKALMSAQALASLLTVALVAARAVNILG